MCTGEIKILNVIWQPVKSTKNNFIKKITSVEIIIIIFIIIIIYL